MEFLRYDRKKSCKLSQISVSDSEEFQNEVRSVFLFPFLEFLFNIILTKLIEVQVDSNGICITVSKTLQLSFHQKTIEILYLLLIRTMSRDMLAYL